MREKTADFEDDPLSYAIIGAGIEVHRRLGPGLLESTYETCLACELAFRGFRVDRQVPIPLVYREMTLDVGYRIDLLVEQAVVVEVKAVEKLHPAVSAQVLTYLRLAGLRTALVINFHVEVLKDGVRRLSLHDGGSRRSTA